jgi:regulator of protease activity HflC (stomatin/prohibitin superfamily)
MLELLHDRDQIQEEALAELRRRFHEFDIECVDVLIGKPDTAEEGGKIESLLEQLRMRQLSIEQIETYERQRAAAEKLRVLNEAQAQANMQTQLTQARVQAQIAESHGEAELAKAKKHAEQTVVMSEAALARARREAEQTIVLAEADSKQKVLQGRGESQRILQEGLAEAAVLLRRVASYGDPRLYAMTLVANELAHSAQPLVPERVFVSGEGSNGYGSSHSSPAGQGALGMLLQLLVADKTSFQHSETAEVSALKALTDRLAGDALATLENGHAS